MLLLAKKGLLDTYTHLTTGITFNYPQTALYEILKIIFNKFDIKYNDRKAIYPKELDIYIPELNYGFEYDGKNFHTEENDKIKDDICVMRGIKLFRINEMSKSNPIPDILSQLSIFNIDVSSIDINKIKDSITKYYMNIDDIEKIISKFTKLAEFRKIHVSLYNFLVKNNMLHMIEHLIPKEITEIDIITSIQSCSNKTEFYTQYKGLYIKMSRNKNLYKNAYDLYIKLIELPPRRTSKPKKLPKTNRKYTEHTCPHCGTIGKGNVMFVHHFDKCKFKDQASHS